MQYLKKTQTRIIQTPTAEAFQTELNAALEELSKNGCKYQLQFNMQMGHCAYIIYDEELKIPETKEDEYALKGELHWCLECPYYIPPMDGRVKYSDCAKGKHVARGGHCCEKFYEWLDAGEIELIEV